jgi:hypothetical protein
MVKVKTVDGTVFDVNDNAAILSGLLKTVLQIDPYQIDDAITINAANDSTMTLLVCYLDYYKDGHQPSRFSRPLYSPDLRLAGANEFDLAFISHLSMSQVKVLLCASDYLDIPSLNELCCAKLASYIKTIPLVQMMNQLGISELDDDWQANLSSKHTWCTQLQQ